MQNIWQQLPKPFLILAPMEDVTDTVFRRIVKKCGALASPDGSRSGPDLFFTEFTNSDGMLSPKGQARVTQRLVYTEEERPLIAQIWGNKPENYYKATKILVEQGFDGVDINMGCPERGIVKKECCAGLIKNPTLAGEIIAATKEAAGTLPVSVKTRCGVNKWVTEEWISFLLDQGLAALTVHGRIASEMSHFPARWEEIAKAVEIRNNKKLDTLIIGNGDVLSYQDAMEKVKTYGVDGVMIGRGVFHNLWVFNKDIDPTTVPLKEKLELLIQHITLFNEVWGKKKNFNIMKKFYKVYTSGVENASEMRTQLMEFSTPEETIEHIRKLINDLH